MSTRFGPRVGKEGCSASCQRCRLQILGLGKGHTAPSCAYTHSHAGTHARTHARTHTIPLSHAEAHADARAWNFLRWTPGMQRVVCGIPVGRGCATHRTQHHTWHHRKPRPATTQRWRIACDSRGAAHATKRLQVMVGDKTQPPLTLQEAKTVRCPIPRRECCAAHERAAHGHQNDRARKSTRRRCRSRCGRAGTICLCVVHTAS